MMLLKHYLLLILPITLVSGHGYNTSPRSRNWVAAEDGMWYGGPDDGPKKEDCPSCLNRKPAAGLCGMVNGRNYDEPKDNLGRPMEFRPQATYTEGQIIEIESIFTANHGGHYYFYACPNGENPTKACFDANPLEMVKDVSVEKYGSATQNGPKDVNYPYRAYVNPNYNKQTVQFKLPQGVSGDKVLLQWWWITGNSCRSDGYETYPWPPGWTPTNTPSCPKPLSDTGEGAPEQFWNCMEVTIEAGNGGVITTPSPVVAAPVTSAPVAAPVAVTSAPVVSDPCDSAVKMSVRFGYYQSWARYRSASCDPVSAADIKVNGYTHLAYSFAKVGADLLIAPWEASDVAEYAAFNDLKNSNTGLKTLIAIGGWSHNDPGELQPRFGQVAATQATRQAFAASVVTFLRQYGFDGLDLDWEYPVAPNRGGTSADYGNYVLLCQELHAQFDAAPEDFLLTMAVPVGYASQYFDFIGLSQYLDWFNLMSYDLHGTWDSPKIIGAHTDMDEIETYIANYFDGIPGNKMVLGLATYGRTYTLADPACATPGCAFIGAGAATSCIQSPGLVSLFEIKDMIAAGQYDAVMYDEDSKSMFMSHDLFYASYDATESFVEKRSFASSKCMRGTMVWAVDMSQDENPTVDNGNPSPVAPTPIVPTPVTPAPVTAAPVTSAPVAPVTSAPVEGCNNAEKMTVRFGYFQSWAQWRTPNCLPINVYNVNTNGYTHLAYSFAKVGADLLISPWNPSDVNEYVPFNNLKVANPGLKTLIAIGGWTHNDPGELQPRFGQVAATQANRQAFATSVVTFLRQYGFDGLDLDWEYPGAPDRGGTPADTANYVLLCQELRAQFDAAPEDFELTMATPIGHYAQYFDFIGLAQHVDYFNVMSYDIHGYWDNPKTIGFHTDMTAIDTFLAQYYAGVPAHQMVLGLGSYGRTYVLADPTCHAPGCAFVNAWPGTACTMSPGYIGLFEIQQRLDDQQYDAVGYDVDSGSMYMSHGTFWVSYDDEYTFALKRGYAHEKCMRGVMEWAVDMSQDAGYNPLVDGGAPVPVPSPVTAPPSPANPNPTPTPPVGGPGTCGNGSVGNGVCADPTLCCSEWGWCGTSSQHCAGNVTPAPVTPAPVTPAPIPSPSAGPTASPSAGPTASPTSGGAEPTTSAPIAAPSRSPSKAPIATKSPTASPSKSPVDTTSSPTASPTKSPTKSPSKSPTGSPIASPTPPAQCVDHTLPINWSGGGIYDCEYYNNHGGTAYCAHAELDAACCFCGGGDQGAPTTPAPVPAGVCMDNELPIEWSGGGVYDCSYYDNHGGTAYCAHAVLDAACCFCGGGVVHTPAPAPDPCDVNADKTTCLTVEGCSWKQEEATCIDAPLTATCQQWNGKRHRCKNEGCKWRSGTMKCKGYWG